MSRAVCRARLRSKTITLKARELHNSPPGWKYGSRGVIEAESAFRKIKHNGTVRRFFQRGLSKAKTKFHLVVLSHNLKKLWAVAELCAA
jgi:hypothetical protein